MFDRFREALEGPLRVRAEEGTSKVMPVGEAVARFVHEPGFRRERLGHGAVQLEAPGLGDTMRIDPHEDHASRDLARARHGMGVRPAALGPRADGR